MREGDAFHAVSLMLAVLLKLQVPSDFTNPRTDLKKETTFA